MLGLIGKRIFSAIPSVIGVLVVTFLLTRALPGDPAAFFAGPAATQEAIEQVRHSLGLDKSLLQQFVVYLTDLAHGDLGNSVATGQRSEEHTSELQSLMRISYAVFCLKKKIKHTKHRTPQQNTRYTEQSRRRVE